MAKTKWIYQKFKKVIRPCLCDSFEITDLNDEYQIKLFFCCSCDWINIPE